MSDDLVSGVIPATFDPLGDALGLDSGPVTAAAGDSEDGAVHIRVQQRNGKKSLTTVSCSRSKQLQSLHLNWADAPCMYCSGKVVNADMSPNFLRVVGTRSEAVIRL